ncbi:hypothetical protein AWE51_13230 [Aquimarina aggregata]|uniref:Uncharacterized protein n=1 Tax=Aquimarina aggregata TaxID=1642818 RepID=A0A162XCZ8_9FLAO|nr:hypothetical protein [Aquimarina aggregata]KZS38558.1 hypothetical protein AWE51_13230 [Aquimarina aggregata]
MEKQNFNPLIEAVISIRHLSIASSKKWTTMKTVGAEVQNNLDQISSLVEKHASESTKSKWKSELANYSKNLDYLKKIMDLAISKINEKKAEGIFAEWNNYLPYVNKLKSNLSNLQSIGVVSLPENKFLDWNTIWSKINTDHIKIENEAEACSIHLKMIEEYSPEEIDHLTDTILKHIPTKYSKDQANLYTEEYMKAYHDIKKEANQKKNLWDRFLDILAGGLQQTPAQRVMIQRWVDGEKGELH